LRFRDLINMDSGNLIRIKIAILKKLYL